MPNIGPMELIIVLVIVLLIFGPKRLPGLGRQLGSGMKEFKESITGSSKDDEDDDRDATGRQLRAGDPPAATTVTPPAATTAQPAPAKAQAVDDREPVAREDA